MNTAAEGATGTTMAAQGAVPVKQGWFEWASSTVGLSSDPNKKVTDAQIALDKAKADLEAAQRDVAAASQGAVQSPVATTMGGGRRRTRRSKRSKKTKRRRGKRTRR
jgi:hypothetical protein